MEQVNQENLPTDSEGHEQFFMEEVAKGEQLCADESKAMEAALCFFRCLKVYPQTEELINIYDKTVPKVCTTMNHATGRNWLADQNAQHVLDILAEMIALDSSTFRSSRPNSTQAARFEGDV